MQKFTMKQKEAAGDKFLGWLKAKYPVAGVTLESEYLPSSYILTKSTTAQILRHSDVLWKMQITANRDVSRVLQSVAHEYCHFKQVFIDKVHYKNIGPDQEREAWMFSAKEMTDYIMDVGEDWRK